MAFNTNNLPRSQWRSTTSYILVTIGAVVGLGNIIQFPYFIAQYGGLFILFFVLCELFVSIPLFLTELMIGFRGKQNPVGSIGLVSLETNANRHWRKVGWLSFWIAFLTLSYYTVQAAFPLGYLWGSLQDFFVYGTDEPVPVAVHGNLMTHFVSLESFFIIFLLLTMTVIIRGINRGLEAISFIVVPTYSLILLCLAMYACIYGNFFASLHALIHMNSEVNVLTVLFAAMGYAFFKLNVGMGTMIVYGSYLPFSTTLGRSTAIIVIFDAVISLLSYFIIHPLLQQANFFQVELNNHSVLYIFSAVPHGIVVAALFFLAAVLAAWTSTIAMAETVAVTLVERFSISRLRATGWVFLGALLIGSFAAMTHTDWMRVLITQTIPLEAITRNITNFVLTPLAALLIAIFAGWVVNRHISQSALEFTDKPYAVWLFLVRYIVPVAIFFVALGGILAWQ